MTSHWTLACSACTATGTAAGLPTTCSRCGSPWLVRYATTPSPEVRSRLRGRPWSMWRYREWMPIDDREEPISLGEGGTPLVRAASLGAQLGVEHLYIKDESQNPTGSFKARGLSAAVTRAVLAGVDGFTVPTAGNAGVALSAYGRRAGKHVTVFAPQTTPPRILQQMRWHAAEVHLVDGHIGNCGKAARAHAAETGAFDVSTLREPYRIEGKKTLGLEIAEQLDWAFPDVIVYPTGGGTGLIGMWIAFQSLRDAGWVQSHTVPRLYSVQATGCAPVVRAVDAGATETEPWENAQTVAAGLRVPAPFGGPLMLRSIAETGGGAVAVSDDALANDQKLIAQTEGIDACPEGGATVAALRQLLERGDVAPHERIVLFNTGAGWLYRV